MLSKILSSTFVSSFTMIKPHVAAGTIGTLLGVVVVAAGGDEKLKRTPANTSKGSIFSFDNPKKWVLDKFNVDCAKWGLATDFKQRFEFKHLLDGVQATDPREAARWNRREWNNKLRSEYYDGSNGRNTFQRYPSGVYGSENRITLVLLKQVEFMRPFMSQLTPVQLGLFHTGLSTHSKYARRDKPLEHQEGFVWYPTKVDVMYGVFNSTKNDYDIYIIQDVYIIVGTKKYDTAKSGRVPYHFEAFVMSRKGEGDAAGLMNSSTPAKLQQRLQRAESWDHFFMQKYFCISR